LNLDMFQANQSLGKSHNRHLSARFRKNSVNNQVAAGNIIASPEKARVAHPVKLQRNRASNLDLKMVKSPSPDKLCRKDCAGQQVSANLVASKVYNIDDVDFVEKQPVTIFKNESVRRLLSSSTNSSKN